MVGDTALPFSMVPHNLLFRDLIFTTLWKYSSTSFPISIREFRAACIVKKMERLLEDAVKVKNILPWIESTEDVINFMRQVPLNKSHLRTKLALRHFITIKDSESFTLQAEIEDEAREIVTAIPDVSYKKIKGKLLLLGNIANRKEIVVRQLLKYRNHDLNVVLRQINSSDVKKRKSECETDDIFASSSSGCDTNINIKIRKVDNDQLEAVSCASSRDIASTSKGFTNEQSPDEPSTSVTSTSTSHSSSGSPDSTFPSTTVESDQELTAAASDAVSDASEPSTSDCLMPVCTRSKARLAKKTSLEADVNSSSTSTNQVMEAPSSNSDDTIIEVEVIPNTTVSSVNTRLIATTTDQMSDTAEPSTSGPAAPVTEYEALSVNEMPVEGVTDEVPQVNIDDSIIEIIELPNSTVSSEDKTVKEPAFDLVKYLRELTSVPELNRLFDDFSEIESGASSSSGSETVEYGNYSAYFRLNLEKNIERYNGVETDPNRNIFKLKEPVLNLNSNSSTAFSRFKLKEPVFTGISENQTALPVPKHLNKSKIPIVQGANLILPKSRKDVIPAAPPMYTRLSNKDKHLPSIASAVETPIVMNANAEEHHVDEVTPMEICSEPVAGPSKVPVEQEAVPSNIPVEPVAAKKRQLDQNLVFRIIEMFPEACPEYVRDICDGKKWEDLDDVVTIILSAPSYPKRRAPSPTKETDPDQQFDIVKALLPDADPTYLKMQCDKYANDERGMKEFINNAMESKDYPTMKEYLRKQQLSAQQKQYTTEFKLENFIELFPDPETTFRDPKRTVKMDSYSEHYLNAFFRNRYDKISISVIRQVLTEQHYKVLESDKVFMDLVARNCVMKGRRRPSHLPENVQNIPVLQELAYLVHKDKIKNYLLEKQKQEEQDRLFAKQNNLMETCTCCFDDEVMPKDTFMCPNGCKFCRDCIKKSCEVTMGESKTSFPCLADCSSEFDLQTLQAALPPKVFSKLAQKKALAEVKAAGIEDLETCPFCDFASIPNEGDKIFRCLNPECMKESCRSCKEPNHLPLKCNEVEKDEAVKARTYIENKMTEALIRKCWKCGTSFFKEEGCNKMTCSCGAIMCYICKQPVKDYRHFNGMGGDKYDKCPLYSNTILVNQENVLNAAKAAKAEIDPSKLKVDPTADIKEHYKSRAKKLPREPHLDILERLGNERQRRRVAEFLLGINRQMQM
ncbi:hypothetical protein NQ315_000954 [Exocentrus adspersus]|uniref:RING-type domain-containing protein n=1 Tax=Exocentrus adspersus TaxID=1586481 RepID=A0AAV8WFD6_9CUCU|nr:hypothetical protein NQ315_000954 [Exocentrus adspersus]